MHGFNLRKILYLNQNTFNERFQPFPIGKLII